MKKTFSRQLALTLSLLLVSMLLLSTAFQFLFSRYLVQRMRSGLEDAADAMSEMAAVLSDNNYASQSLLRVELNYTARTTGSDVLLVTTDGFVAACSDGQQACPHLGYCFDSIGQMPADKRSADQQAEALYGERRIAACVPIQWANDMVIGYVVVSDGYEDLNTVMKDAVRLNLLIVAVILPIAVGAVYLLGKRQTKPMKQLAEAARKLGRGQTDVRVPTGGSNSAEMDELAVAFNNMAQALSASEQKRQEFVANVSHELKTLMTTISGYMDGMLDGTIPSDQHPKYMALISGEVKRLSRLVRSMLEVSRLQDKGIPVEKMQPFDICEVMGLALITFEQKINGKRLNVDVDFPETGAKALADEDAITQVVYNLIDNAVKFCPEEGELRLAVKQAVGGKLLISVANTGATIPPEELPLVFDRFHKTDKSRSIDRDGVGLGLYIVKTILCSHEEDIFVTSRDGVTTFTFTLRRAATETVPEAEVTAE